MRFAFLYVLAAGLLAATVRASTVQTGSTALYTPGQLRRDLAVIEKTMKESHPDIAFSVAPGVLEDAMRSLSAELDHAMSRDEAWRVFAKLNPILADAHTGIFFPDWRKEARMHLARGGAFFPYEVVATAEGKLTILSALGGAKTPRSGVRISSIGGTPSSVIVKDLLSRVHGDTATFRANLLSRRFWFFYWKTYGNPASFDLKLDAGAGKTVPVTASH